MQQVLPEPRPVSGLQGGAEVRAFPCGSGGGRLSQKWGDPGPTKQKRLFPPDEAGCLTTSCIVCLPVGLGREVEAQAHPSAHWGRNSKGQRGAEACPVSHSKRVTGPDFSGIEDRWEGPDGGGVVVAEAPSCRSGEPAPRPPGAVAGKLCCPPGVCSHPAFAVPCTGKDPRAHQAWILRQSSGRLGIPVLGLVLGGVHLHPREAVPFGRDMRKQGWRPLRNPGPHPP